MGVEGLRLPPPNPTKQIAVRRHISFWFLPSLPLSPPTIIHLACGLRVAESPPAAPLAAAPITHTRTRAHHQLARSFASQCFTPQFFLASHSPPISFHCFKKIRFRLLYRVKNESENERETNKTRVLSLTLPAPDCHALPRLPRAAAAFPIERHRDCAPAGIFHP